MSGFWKGSFAPMQKAKSGFNGATCQENGVHWFVEEVSDGFAQVVVYFDHECHHADGKVTTPPSNTIGYIYEVEVGYGRDEAEIEADIAVRLGENPTPPELLSVIDSA